MSGRSSTLSQYVTNSTQFPLASNTSASHLQDRSTRVEVCPWCCSSISAGTRCPGRRRPRAPTATVCIYSMYSVTNGNRWVRQRDSEVLRSMVRQFGTVCHQLCATAVCHWGHSRDVLLRPRTMTNTIQRCLDVLMIVAPSINAQTYLLTRQYISVNISVN